MLERVVEKGTCKSPLENGPKIYKWKSISKYKLTNKETLALSESVTWSVVHKGKGSMWRAQVSQDAGHWIALQPLNTASFHSDTVSLAHSLAASCLHLSLFS